MSLSTGARLGPYEILAAIGAGGMGEVYRARDGNLGRDVAIKVLPEALAGDADYMSRFQREAQMLASLNHPNIAAIYGVEERALVIENLKDEQRFRLRDILRYNLKTVRAYLLKEAFQQLWDYQSAAWAGKFLDEWCHHTMRSRIEPMKKIARSLREHRELILNYFRAKKTISSGTVEGLNNKAKVTMRKSYGFRTFRVLELTLYHSLGKHPEPESTHDFF